MKEPARIHHPHGEGDEESPPPPRAPAPPFEEPEEFEPSYEDAAIAAVVQIDRRDDVASVCGRIDMAPTYAVVVHAPRGNRVLSTELGMRRLKRHVDDTGKVIAFATRRRGLAARARQVGFAVGSRPDKIRWDAPGRSVLFLPGFSLALPPIGRYVRAVVALAIVLALGAGVLAIGPSAHITAVPASTPLETVLQVVAVPDGGEAPEGTLAVPAEPVSFTLLLTLVVPTTGTVLEDTARATVVVTITNSGAAAVTLPAGTTVDAGGLEFAIAEETEVPAGSPLEGVLAVAVERGSAYNLPPATITAFTSEEFAELDVTNPGPSTGGVTESVAAVAAADIRALREQEAAILSSPSFRAQLDSLHREDAVVPQTASIEGRELNDAPRAGDPGDVIVMPYELAVTALAITRERLEGLAEDAFAAEGAGALVGNSVRATIEGASYDAESETYTLTLAIEAQVSLLDENAVRSAVQGKSPGDAAAALLEVAGVEDGSVGLTPGWAPWLPRFGFRIDVTLELPEDGAALED